MLQLSELSSGYCNTFISFVDRVYEKRYIVPRTELSDNQLSNEFLQRGSSGNGLVHVVIEFPRLIK